MTCTEIYCIFEMCWKYKMFFSGLLYSKTVKIAVQWNPARIRQSLSVRGCFLWPVQEGEAAGQGEQALAGLLAGALPSRGYCISRLTSSPARPLQLTANLVTQLGLCRATHLLQEEYGNMNTCSLCATYLFYSLSILQNTTIQGSSAIYCASYYQRKIKISLCLNLGFSSRLNWWWLFLQEI